MKNLEQFFSQPKCFGHELKKTTPIRFFFVLTRASCCTTWVLSDRPVFGDGPVYPAQSYYTFKYGGWSSHPADLLLPPSPPFISSPPFNSHHLRLRLSDSPPFLVSSRHETSSRGHLQQCQCLEGSVQTALDAILFTQTCSMTRCVELPTSIWSSLMLWTRLGVREVRWKSSFSESNSVGLFPWPPVLFSYIYCIPPSPHRWSDRSLQLLSSRSTFNLRLSKNMQGAKFVYNQTPALRLSWDFLQRPQSTICMLQTKAYQWVRYTSSGGLR
jgi:hypothetical protein